MTLPPVTPDLKPLAAALGPDGLLKLLEARAGTRLPVPIKVGRSGLVDELGGDVAEALVRHWGGTMLKVPLAREWRVQIYHGRGSSYAEIALRLGLTERGVWRILNASGLTGARARAPKADCEPSSQFDLFASLSDETDET